MRKYTVIVFLLLVAAGHAQTNNKSVAGYVKDAKNKTIPAATVQLYHSADSALLGTGSSDANGKFQFDSLSTGVYFLHITATGQRPLFSVPFSIDSLQPLVMLPVIIMSPAKDAELEEVIIKAKRPLLVQEIDKTVVNVESMLSSASSNSLELLEKTPGITVSAQGDISLNGRSGILVLIDGRPTYMSGTDLASYLRSLPGSLLDKIELMDNPPARYDAAGNGIINIRLKKNRAGGFTGNLSLGYTQGKYAQMNDALNLNYNYKKINLFGNIGVNRGNNYNTDVYDRRFYEANGDQTSSLLLNTHQLYRSKNVNAFFGADYSPSAATTLGFQLNFNHGRRHGSFEYGTQIYNATGFPDSSGAGSTYSEDRRRNIGANINFLHKFGKDGRELSADLNYLQYNAGGSRILQNLLYDKMGSPVLQTDFLYLLPGATSIYTVKIDYLHPFGKLLQLETGLKSSWIDNDNKADYFNTANGIAVIDNRSSNHFLYSENINGAYLNLQGKWKKFGVQTGLRAENTRSTGYQLGNDSVKESRFTKSYTQFFPSLFLSYKPDSNGHHTITASITRRINRPNYQLLNPFRFMRDQYSYTGGNPELGAQYQYRYELRYQYKQFLRVGLSYNRYSNIIFQTTDVVDNIFITRPENIAQGYMLLFNTGTTLAPAKWWKLNADVMVSRLGLHGISYGEQLNPNTYSVRVNLLNQLQFQKGWSAEWGGNYSSRDLNGQAFTNGMYRVNAAVQKKIWKDRGSIRISIDDIFHSWIYHYSSVGLKQANFLQTGESDTQRIGLGFTYRFGKSSFARKSRHTDDASDDEKNRVN